MSADVLTETVQLLESLSARAQGLAGALPSLDLSPADLTRLAGEVERIGGRLASVEERVAALGPVPVGGVVDRALSRLAERTS